MNCPQCRGRKTMIVLFPIYADETPVEERRLLREIACVFCDGTGEVDEGFEARAKKGDALSGLRSLYGITLREFSRRSGVKPGIISDFERGKIVQKYEEDQIMILVQKLARDKVKP